MQHDHLAGVPQNQFVVGKQGTFAGDGVHDTVITSPWDGVHADDSEAHVRFPLNLQ